MPRSMPYAQVPGTYERMSTEKPRRIYAQKEGLDCEPNCRDLQAKRTEESPLVARFGSEVRTRRAHFVYV